MELSFQKPGYHQWYLAECSSLLGYSGLLGQHNQTSHGQVLSVQAFSWGAVCTCSSFKVLFILWIVIHQWRTVQWESTGQCAAYLGLSFLFLPPRCLRSLVSPMRQQFWVLWVSVWFQFLFAFGTGEVASEPGPLPKYNPNRSMFPTFTSTI